MRGDGSVCPHVACGICFLSSFVVVFFVLCADKSHVSGFSSFFLLFDGVRAASIRSVVKDVENRGQRQCSNRAHVCFKYFGRETIFQRSTLNIAPGCNRAIPVS